MNFEKRDTGNGVGGKMERERERESIPEDSTCKLYVTWTRERVSWEMVLHSFAHFAALA